VCDLKCDVSEMTPKRSAHPRLSPLEMQNVQQLVYERLKEGIISNEFPPGAQLFVRELAEQLGTSTTPVVHAVLRLSQEGLLKVSSRKGTFVADLGEKEIRLLFEAREAVETHAATLTAVRASAHHIEELGAILDRWSGIRRSLSDGVPSAEARQLFEADSQFHSRIVQLAGNPYLDETYHKLDALVWACTRRALSRYHAQVQEVAHEGHLRILDALARHEPVRAAEAVRTHLWEVHLLYTQLMQPGKSQTSADVPSGTRRERRIRTSTST
jgi:DNA-binding GntR family transcriptional regulator